MIPSNQRHNIVLMHEGQALQYASSHGTDIACEFARCQIDGAFNALMRMGGTDAAQEFAFALSDRMVGRLKTPTPWPPIPAPSKITEPPITLEKIAAPKSETPTPRKLSARLAFGLGWLAGFAMGSVK